MSPLLKEYRHSLSVSRWSCSVPSSSRWSFNSMNYMYHLTTLHSYFKECIISPRVRDFSRRRIFDRCRANLQMTTCVSLRPCIVSLAIGSHSCTRLGTGYEWIDLPKYAIHNPVEVFVIFCNWFCHLSLYC